VATNILIRKYLNFNLALYSALPVLFGMSQRGVERGAASGQRQYGGAQSFDGKISWHLKSANPHAGNFFDDSRLLQIDLSNIITNSTPYKMRPTLLQGHVSHWFLTISSQNIH
jgi:hypothetical protein